MNVLSAVQSLQASPLFALSATLFAYCCGLAAARTSGNHPMVNPVGIAIAVLVLILHFSHLDYAVYFDGARFIHFLLGPATVALAVPLMARWDMLRRHRWAVLIGMTSGAIVSTASAMALAWWLGASPTTLLSLAAKSVTTPIAMGISDKIGGVPALTAVLCITTGILGAVLAPYVFPAMGITSRLARGLAMGTASHGIGTARAFQWHPETGAFAGLALGLHGILAALILPPLVLWWRA